MEKKLMYMGLGTADEAGEVAGKIKKLFRDLDGIPTDEFKKALVKEMGDVLWYLARIASIFNVSLDSIFDANMDKLNDRLERGVLEGDGDNR